MKKHETKNTQMSVITENGEVIENVSQKKTISTRKKAVIGAAAILGACTLLFGGATQMALAAETGKVETVPTTYKTTPAQKNLKDLEGYVKGNYTVVKNPDSTDQPSANDISMEKAADIGAQHLWKMFGTNLDGKKIEMTYVKAVAPNERSRWYGWIADETYRGSANKNSNITEMSYGFEIDSLTGDINAVNLSRVLPGGSQGNLSLEDASASQGYDANLEKNCKVYQDLARAITEQHHLLDGNIKSVEYYGQGRTNNDPDIVIAVKSDLGEEIRLTYSRADKTLLSYCSNSWVRTANLLEQDALNNIDDKNVVAYEVTQDENGNPVTKLVKGDTQNAEISFFAAHK